MTRRRWRRMELARPARDAVVVRESTVVVRFPFSRTRSRVGRPARHFVLRLFTAGFGPERRGSEAGDGSGLSGRSTVGPRCGLTTRILRPNRRSVKWPLCRHCLVERARRQRSVVRAAAREASTAKDASSSGSPRRAGLRLRLRIARQGRATWRMAGLPAVVLLARRVRSAAALDAHERLPSQRCPHD